MSRKKSSGHTVASLRAEAKTAYARGKGNLGLKGYGKMKKAQLEELLGYSGTQKKTTPRFQHKKTAERISKLASGVETKLGGREAVLKAVKKAVDKTRTAARKEGREPEQQELRKAAIAAIRKEAGLIKERNDKASRKDRFKIHQGGKQQERFKDVPTDVARKSSEKVSDMFDYKLQKGDILGALNQSSLEFEQASVIAKKGLKDLEEQEKRLTKLAKDALEKYPALEGARASGKITPEQVVSTASKLGLLSDRDPYDSVSVVAAYMSSGVSKKDAVKLVNKGKTSLGDVPSAREGYTKKEVEELGVNTFSIRKKASELRIGNAGDSDADLFTRISIYNGFETVSMKPKEREDYIRKINIFPPGQLPKQISLEDLVRETEQLSSSKTSSINSKKPTTELSKTGKTVSSEFESEVGSQILSKGLENYGTDLLEKVGTDITNYRGVSTPDLLSVGVRLIAAASVVRGESKPSIHDARELLDYERGFGNGYSNEAENMIREASRAYVSRMSKEQKNELIKTYKSGKAHVGMTETAVALAEELGVSTPRVNARGLR